MAKWRPSLEAFRQGDFRGCLETLRPLITTYGPQPEWAALAAEAHLALQEVSEAQAMVASGLQAAPRSQRLWRLAADIWRGQGQGEAADAADARAASLAAGDPAPALPPAGLAEPWPALFAASAARPTVGACLIVRDEAAHLAACLQALAGLDEIVVVDTGSTDGSEAIARQFGAKVGWFAWCDDFAAARNAALALCTTDWVLSIDADEVLEGGPAALRRSIEEVGTSGTVLCPLVVDRDNGMDTAVGRVPRLFARRPGRHFAGRLHERIRDEAPLLDWAVDAWRLVHHGRSQAAVADRGKYERNLAILQQWRRDEPEHADVHYFLGCEFAAMGRHDDALACFRRALELTTADVDRAPILVQYLLSLEALDRQPELLALAAEVEGTCSELPDYWLVLGRAHAWAGDRQAATACYRRAQALGGEPAGVLETPGARTWQPTLSLARLDLAAGQMDQVVAELRANAERFAGDPAAAAAGLQLFLETGRTQEAVNWCRSLLSQPGPRASLADALVAEAAKAGLALDRLEDAFAWHAGGFEALARRLAGAGRWEEVEGLCRRWGTQVGAPAALYSGYAWNALGDAFRAERAFRMATEYDPDRLVAWHNLGVLAARRGDGATAVASLEAARRIDGQAVAVLVELAAAYLQMGNRQAASEVFAAAKELGQPHPGIERLAPLLGARGTAW